MINDEVVNNFTTSDLSKNGSDDDFEDYDEVMFVRRLIEQSLAIYDLEVFEKGTHPYDAAERASSILESYLDAEA